MRIVHLLPQFSCGGAELLSGLIALWQQKRGHQVYVFTLTEPEASFFRTSYQKEIQEKLNIAVTQARWCINPLRMGRVKTWKDELERIQPDVVHSHLYEADGLALSYIRNKTLYCCHVHGPIPPPVSWKECLVRRVELHIMKQRYKHKQVRFIAISRAMRDYILKQLRVDEGQRIYVLYNPIELRRFPFRQRWACGSPVRLITVGNLIPRKQHRFLIDVVYHLKQQGFSAHLTIVGGGPLGEALQQQIAQYGLQDCVRITGTVGNVEHYLDQADLYVHAAQPEPLGLALLEAMACGLPALVLDGGGISELIRPGQNGWIIPQRDVALFAGAIKQVADDNELYALCSAGARAAAEKYDIASYIVQLETVYQKALEEMSNNSA
ncbi:MAG: glycosyltransferase family 4 protein [Chitinophagales bacterium]|nr:glycosyltransferase family 4 protein [Chitinophagales bacterium]MDW8428838.1 glycosyltransferase family 4 protein [Chitinophagales bacterium]